MPIRAITFDFWRTLFTDGALPNTNPERNQLRVDALARNAGVPPSQAEDALKKTYKSFLMVHVHEQRTLVPNDALPLLEEELQVTFSSESAKELTEIFGTAILEHPPEPIEGALDAVRAASQKVPIGLISDTGISPGSSLEVLLVRHGIRELFQVLSFSDVVGVAKPQPAMYEHARGGLDVQPAQLLHIGDLEPTDIQGALRFGAQAALFAGDNERFLDATEAHYTFTSWGQFVEQLPALLDGAS